MSGIFLLLPAPQHNVILIHQSGALQRYSPTNPDSNGVHLLPLSVATTPPTPSSNQHHNFMLAFLTLPPSFHRNTYPELSRLSVLPVGHRVVAAVWESVYNVGFFMLLQPVVRLLAITPSLGHVESVDLSRPSSISDDVFPTAQSHYSRRRQGHWTSHISTSSDEDLWESRVGDLESGVWPQPNTDERDLDDLGRAPKVGMMSSPRSVLEGRQEDISRLRVRLAFMNLLTGRTYLLDDGPGKLNIFTRNVL
ncbi:unnamed protein product [Protopolystoma xenopodis]|uniref:Uncharacterized protein n=1 Tax=Protopolystoma xenopodis TaxID=117903 RepID=A0A3S5BDS4_9PLAT|nr:unnamed protein product [Protopolystoma xenopodis]